MRAWTIICTSLLAISACSQKPETLRASLGEEDIAKGWIYEDIDKGYARAKETGKPLLVVFRCVP